MRDRILVVVGLMAALARPVGAGTFAPTPIAPDASIDALTRGVARERVGRDVFADPYATATISHVDVYDRFPYVETRHFQVVSDPRWNRLVCGEMGRSLGAFDGRGSAVGALKGPRGMAVDERDRLYVADTGNDRIVVLQATTEFDRIELVPLYTIPNLSGPYDVAYSDGGTPFQAEDDLLYVADTGRNRVGAYALSSGGARLLGFVGELGSGDGFFAGPTALTVGRADGVNTSDVFVADAHNARLVHLRLQRGGLRWVGEAPTGAGVVTSLDTDEWGNLYAAAPQQGVVRKFNPDLEPVADLRGAIARPKSFRIPYTTVRDHRDGSVTRQGQSNAFSVDQWGDASGLRQWNLGLGIDRLSVTDDAAPAAQFMLTDRGAVSLEVSDPTNGRVISRRDIGTLAAGQHSVALTDADVAGVQGPSDLVLRLTAASGYRNVGAVAAQTNFRSNGGSAVALPSQPKLLGNWPNPARANTRISFLLPASVQGKVSLGIYDANGRRLRSLDRGFTPGMNEVLWDGADEGGRPVRSGVYFYRLDVGAERFTRRVAVVR